MIFSIPVFSFLTHVITLILGTSVFFGKSFKVFFLLTTIVSSLIMTKILLPDYAIYLEIYNSLNPNLKLSEQHLFWAGEPLYLYINYFFKKITNNFSYLHFLLVFIPLSIKIAFLIKWSESYFVSFVFYISILFFADSYLLRSTFASGIVLIGVWLLFNEKSKYQFFLTIIIASLIHISALIALPVWYFQKISLNKQKGFITLIIIFFLGLIGIGHYLEKFISIFLPNEWYIVSTVSNYSFGNYGQSVGLIRPTILIYSIIAIFFISYRSILIKRFKNYDFILCLTLYSLFILIGFNDFEILADRLFRIFSFFIVLALGQILSCIKGNQRLFVFSILILFFNVVPYLTAPPYLIFLN
jgi:hypothetical protein